ncbi:hypothetical protein C7M84_009901, partial [Penaeus vannamei]
PLPSLNLSYLPNLSSSSLRSISVFHPPAFPATFPLPPPPDLAVPSPLSTQLLGRFHLHLQLFPTSSAPCLHLPSRLPTHTPLPTPSSHSPFPHPWLPSSPLPPSQSLNLPLNSPSTPLRPLAHTTLPLSILPPTFPSLSPPQPPPFSSGLLPTFTTLPTPSPLAFPSPSPPPIFPLAFPPPPPILHPLTTLPTPPSLSPSPPPPPFLLPCLTTLPPPPSLSPSPPPPHSFSLPLPLSLTYPPPASPPPPSPRSLPPPNIFLSHSVCTSRPAMERLVPRDAPACLGDERITFRGSWQPPGRTLVATQGGYGDAGVQLLEGYSLCCVCVCSWLMPVSMKAATTRQPEATGERRSWGAGDRSGAVCVIVLGGSGGGGGRHPEIAGLAVGIHGR